MKTFLSLFILLCITAASLHAQDIESKLSGNTATQGFTVKNNSGTGLFTIRGTGHVGLGTVTPSQARLEIENPAGSTNAIRIETNSPSGWSGIYLNQLGLGNAARFTIGNAASINNCLEASTNGTGAALSVSSTNTGGRITEFKNGSTDRFFVETGGDVGISGNVGIGTGTNAPAARLEIAGVGSINAIRAYDWSSTVSGIFLSQAGTGNAARFDITNASSTNNCLEATTSAAAPAIYANSTSASGRIIQANNGSSTVRFFVESGGNVGIGVDDATQDLDVLNNARFRGVGSQAYSAPLNLTSTGILTTATSDARLKTDIRPLGASLEKILRLQGVRYNWKSDPDGADRIGFIAQEVEEVIPEVVYTNPVDGYKGLNYAELTAVLTEAMKEQQVLIDALRQRTEEVAALRQRVHQLESQYSRIHELEQDLVSLKAQLHENGTLRDRAHASLQSVK
ncbi:MAG: tail fiber domain-containing protein [Bacteroidota bacterium]|jgi:hypothetical protein